MKVSIGFLFIACIGLFAYAATYPGDTMPSALAAGPACLECHDNYAEHTAADSHLQTGCEDCHGVPDPAISIEQAHEQLFKPGMEQFDSPDFCFRCHKK